MKASSDSPSMFSNVQDKQPDKPDIDRSLFTISELMISEKNSIQEDFIIHYHDNYEILFLKIGNLRTLCKGRWFSLTDGDIMYYPPNAIHRIDYLDPDHYTRVLLLINRDSFLPALNALHCEALLSGVSLTMPCKLTLSKERFYGLLRLVDEALASYTSYMKEGSRVALGVTQARVISILYELVPLFSAGSYDMQKNNPEYISGAVQYIDRHFTSPISLDELAERLHISKYHLCRSFKKDVGMTIVQYRQYRQILEARKLMLFDDKPIDIISDQCGFGSLEYFYRVFQKMVGCTPAQYLQRYHKD